MQKLNFLSKLLLVFTFFASGCAESPWFRYEREKQNDVNDKLTSGTCPLFDQNQILWIDGPHLKKQSEFRIHFLETPPSFEVELYMPSMGHGSVPTKIEPLDDLTFRVFNVFFIMAGSWEIRIRQKEVVFCTYQVEI